MDPDAGIFEGILPLRKAPRGVFGNSPKIRRLADFRLNECEGCRRASLLVNCLTIYAHVMSMSVDCIY